MRCRLPSSTAPHATSPDPGLTGEPGVSAALSCGLGKERQEQEEDIKRFW
jgi:hypothetical protein